MGSRDAYLGALAGLEATRGRRFHVLVEESGTGWGRRTKVSQVKGVLGETRYGNKGMGMVCCDAV